MMNQTESLPTRVRAARDAIEHNVPAGLAAPIVGIVLGTGMGSVTSLISEPVRVPYSEIPFFQTSTVEGHAGELVFGRIDSVPIVALNGRCHFYEGYSTDEICFPIEVLCSFQIASLIIGNASGGINPKFKSGEVMLLDDHIDLFFRTKLEPEVRDGLIAGDTGQTVEWSLFKQAAYSHRLNQWAACLADENNLVLHRGVYAALTGPNYETRSEYRFLKRIGADVVGMSTIPEANVAVKNGVEVCGLSTITNVANPDVRHTTSHKEVIAAVAIAEKTLLKIVSGLVGRHRVGDGW